MKLSEDDIALRLMQSSNWREEEEKWMVRKFRFASFPAAIHFVDRVAEQAEQLNHHPMIAIDYRMVTLRLTTWSQGGLTELDFTSATRYDQIYAAMAEAEG